MRLNLLPTATGRDTELVPSISTTAMFIPCGSTGGASSGGVFQASSEYAAEMGKIIIIASSNSTALTYIGQLFPYDI